MTTRLFGMVTVLAIAAGCASPPDSPPAEEGQTAGMEAHDMPQGSAAPPATSPTTDAEIIRSATSAAPEAVSGAATVLGFDEKMQPRTLRQGTNGWTCLPDVPHTPGADPMCVDQGGMAWVQAWMAKQDPPAGKMGFGYMLMGGSDASNDDPFAGKPAEGHEWIDTGPHVMIFNIGDRFDGYPTTHDNPKAPYVMWSDTPYRHLMIPVQ